MAHARGPVLCVLMSMLCCSIPGDDDYGDDAYDADGGPVLPSRGSLVRAGSAESLLGLSNLSSSMHECMYAKGTASTFNQSVCGVVVACRN